METSKERRGAQTGAAVFLLCALLGCSADRASRSESPTGGGTSTRSSEPVEGRSDSGALATSEVGSDASVSARRDGGAATSASGGAGANAPDAGAKPAGGASATVARAGDAAATLPADAAQDGASAAVNLPPDDRFSVLMCPGATPNVTSFDQLPRCDGEILCGESAHCVPLERLPAAQIERMPDCSAGKCVPDRLSILRRFSFKPCEGELGEGRCIPLCFALVRNRLSNLLARGDFGCGKEEVCAPCADPVEGTPTGACDNDPCAE